MEFTAALRSGSGRADGTVRRADTVPRMATPRLAVGIVLAALLSSAVATPAMAADAPPAFDPTSPTCVIQASTASVVALDDVFDPIPIKTDVAYSCGQILADGMWSFSWTSSSGAVIPWSPGPILYRPPTQISYTPATRYPHSPLAPGVWTLKCVSPAGCSVTSAPLTVVGTTHVTATATRSGSRFTVSGSVDRLAAGGRVPYADAVVRIQQYTGSGWSDRAFVASSATGAFSYSSTSTAGLLLRAAVDRVTAAPFVEAGTSTGVNLPSYTPAPPAPPAPPVTTPAPPVTTPAPPVTTPAPPVTTPAPPVSSPAPPVTQPAPPVTDPAPPVKAKAQTVLSASSVKRSGGRLTLKATLIDRDRARALTAVVKLQRWTVHGWKTVATLPTGRSTVRTPKASYRLVFAGTAKYAASTSKVFTR
jgi:hypothetical protein